MSKSKSEPPAGGRGPFGPRPAQPLERLLATGLGSRGGPNKASNKLRSRPLSYAAPAPAPAESVLAAGRRSRGGPNKASNKLRSRPGSYPPR